MARALIILLVVITLPGFAQGSDNSLPSHEQIKKWWRAEYPDKPDEEIEVHKVKPIRLKSGEKAFLATTTFHGRGRCCESVVLLIRPTLQKAREIEETFSSIEVRDLDGDEVSEISTHGGFCGQGTCVFEKMILYFDGWEPNVLHSRGFGDNEGACGSESGYPCYMSEVEWTFRELDDDHTVDLVEFISYSEHDEPHQWKLATKINTYLFKDKVFIPTELALDQSDRLPEYELERFFCSCPAESRDCAPQNVNEPFKVLKGELVYSSGRCLGLRVADDKSAEIIGIRFSPKITLQAGPVLRTGNKVEVKCTYKNGFLYGRSVQLTERDPTKRRRIRTAPWKPQPKPTKRDCSKHIQLLTKASDQKDMRAKAREYIYCLIQAGLPLEKATTHVMAVIETLNELQKTSINPEKLQLLGPALSRKTEQRDKAADAAYPPEANRLKDVSKRDEDQTHPKSQAKSEKKPFTEQAVVADISEIKIHQNNLRTGTLLELKNVSDHDLEVGVTIPTESLAYSAIVRKLEQKKLPTSEWARFGLIADDTIIVAIIADTFSYSINSRLKQLNGRKIEVSVWKGQEHIQSLSIPIRVSQDLLDSAE